MFFLDILTKLYDYQKNSGLKWMIMVEHVSGKLLSYH